MPSPRTRLIVAMLILAAGFPSAGVAQQQSPAVGLAAQTDTGTRPYIPYDGAAENINLTNGNVNLKVPLVHLPGRDGFTYHVARGSEGKERDEVEQILASLKRID